MAGKGYTIIDHTADIGLEATGSDLNEAFVNAAGGMFDILSDDSHIRSLGSFEVMVEGDTLEDLLVDYLTRLLFLYEVEGYLFSEFGVDISRKGMGNGGCCCNGDGGGIEVDSVRKGVGEDSNGEGGGWSGVYGRMEIGGDGKGWVERKADEVRTGGDGSEVDGGDRREGGYVLKGYAKGEPFDTEKHNYPLEIKAVTYHMLEVMEVPARVQVIFDL